jgi:hypothetical protein
MRRSIPIIAFVIALFLVLPSILIAQDFIKTGYDLYQLLKNWDTATEPADLLQSATAVGYLKGYIDGIALTQDSMYNMMFPPNQLSEKESEKIAKEFNFRRINIPEDGLAVGQVMMIYKKWANEHPEKLNGTARVCVHLSLIKAYGWK